MAWMASLSWAPRSGCRPFLGTLLGVSVTLAALGLTVALTAPRQNAIPGFPLCLPFSYDYTFGWNYTDEVIMFALVVPGAPGWVGMGISEFGTMAGADIAIAVRNESSPMGFSSKDYYGIANGRPQLDPQQDVELVQASFYQASVSYPSMGETHIILKRKLQTCDERDVAIRPGLPTYMIWAYGDVDASTGLPNYHGVRRGSDVLMLIPPSNSTADAADTSSSEESERKPKVLDIRMNLTVPSTTTNYLCTHFVLPNDTKYHIVKYEVAHTSLVNRVVLFGCRRQPEQMLQGFPCLENTTVDDNCGLLLLSWAPGKDSVDLPPDVGIPIGGTDFPTWTALQVQYENPGNLEGQVDTSGFRVYYTSQLRKHDAGILLLGQSNLTIPPGQPTVSTPPDVCPSSCTSKFSGPLTIMSSAYHMHKIGVSAVTRVIRNGTELPPLGQITHFSFERQVPSFVPQESSTLLPGDTLITSCTYNSTSRQNVTHYGHSADRAEMCFNFLLYYPRQQGIDVCEGLDEHRALCTSNQRVTDLVGARDRKPSEAQLQEYEEQGWVVNSSMPEFRPFSEFEGCRQVVSGRK